MEVHVVDKKNSALYRDELKEFFQIRHSIYVDEKGWRPSSIDGEERDQFDTPNSTYLIGIIDGQIVCGSRFIPTDQPHLLADVFGELCDIELVRDPLVLEWTRGFIIPEYRESAGIRIKAQSCAAVMDYCLENGFNEVGGIQEAYWLPLWRRLGWKIRKVGNRTLIGDTWCLPAFFSVSEEARNSARKWGGISETNLFHATSESCIAQNTGAKAGVVQQ